MDTQTELTHDTTAKNDLLLQEKETGHAARQVRETTELLVPDGSKDEMADGIDGMNKCHEGGVGGERSVAMNGMNKVPSVGGWGNVVGDGSEIAYIGETSRPLRERVWEHI